MNQVLVSRPALPAGALARSAPLFDPAKELALEHARQLASRRAFMALKFGVLKIAAEVHGAPGTRLQQRVRQARRAADLLALQSALADALPAEPLRQELAQQIERLFSPLDAYA
jgi:truncated hemoglobin YjbI